MGSVSEQENKDKTKEFFWSRKHPHRHTHKTKMCWGGKNYIKRKISFFFPNQRKKRWFSFLKNIKEWNIFLLLVVSILSSRVPNYPPLSHTRHIQNKKSFQRFTHKKESGGRGGGRKRWKIKKRNRQMIFLKNRQKLKEADNTFISTGVGCVIRWWSFFVSFLKISKKTVFWLKREGGIPSSQDLYSTDVSSEIGNRRAQISKELLYKKRKIVLCKPFSWALLFLKKSPYFFVCFFLLLVFLFSRELIDGQLHLRCGTDHRRCW